nr:MAG TPA: hypothetical protein [Caudoviricetes sp.]
MSPPSSRNPNPLSPPFPAIPSLVQQAKRQSSINPRRRSPDLAEYGFRRHFVKSSKKIQLWQKQ